jgi:hypothetical protein
VIFGEKKSALVRLTDSLKVGLTCSAATAAQILNVFEPYEAPFREAQSVARCVLSEQIDAAEGDALMTRILSPVPEDVCWQGAALQGQLHSQALSAILLSCFCLESYVNSLAYFLFYETDFLGLIKGGHRAPSDLLIEAIERMSTRDKWKTIGRLTGQQGFDRSRSPFQDFQILFNFRDDHVHDKVVDYSDERARKRYNDKFPDPIFGLLTLRHAIYAATTYWAMVASIHQIIDVPSQIFHRHYNLAPWGNEEHRQELEATAAAYDRRLGPGTQQQ